MSRGRVIALHSGKRATGRSVETRPLTEAEQATRTECQWFYSCKRGAMVVVTGEVDGDVPVCDKHLATVPAKRQLRVLGLQRAALKSQMDKLDREIGLKCQEADRTYGEWFPILDMARVTGIARSTIIRWLDRVEDGAKS